jgi:phosphatidylserine decarboxylase
VTIGAQLLKILAQEDVNFLLTNRVPRNLLTRFVGWFSRIENPLLARLAIAVWRRFDDLELDDAQEHHFDSVRACFTRSLKPGARPVAADSRIVVSPCDGIVGACGRIHGDQLLQAKGFAYTVGELLLDPVRASYYRDGLYVTLRLTSGMYHRFHAPHDGTIDGVRFIGGDTWNVNPIALARIARLFCKNQRAVLPLRLRGSELVLTLVPVAAILVASIRLHCLGVLDGRYRGNPLIACRTRYGKGEEIGWFEHGSTIIVLAPAGLVLGEDVRQGARIRMGRPLMQLPEQESPCVS